ncbi:MAG: hypothetical protein GX055_07770 [Desulfovibrionales bacterium]|nr:hypothetical protein [Desulfovibrionales bacterium]
MNNPFTSVFDLVDNDPSGACLKSIQDDLLSMDMRIRRQMDAGLTPTDMTTAQAARSAVQAAQRILEKLQS